MVEHACMQWRHEAAACRAWCFLRRYQWFGVALRNLDWWGAFSYTVGVGLYWIAALSTMINDCPNSTLDPIVYVSYLNCLPHACVRTITHLSRRSRQSVSLHRSSHLMMASRDLSLTLQVADTRG